jgi:hypothetical protein
MDKFSCAAGRGLELEIPPFLEELIGAGYAPQELSQRRTILLAFARWVQDERLTVADLSKCPYRGFRGTPSTQSRDAQARAGDATPLLQLSSTS